MNKYACSKFIVRQFVCKPALLYYIQQLRCYSQIEFCGFTESAFLYEAARELQGRSIGIFEGNARLNFHRILYNPQGTGLPWAS
jgi:hypothetical protein